MVIKVTGAKKCQGRSDADLSFGVLEKVDVVASYALVFLVRGSSTELGTGSRFAEQVDLFFAAPQRFASVQ